MLLLNTTGVQIFPLLFPIIRTYLKLSHQKSCYSKKPLQIKRQQFARKVQQVTPQGRVCWTGRCRLRMYSRRHIRTTILFDRAVYADHGHGLANKICIHIQTQHRYRPFQNPQRRLACEVGPEVELMLREKKAIQSKLETSIAAGEMPPFCENCGAIETPTWRKAWVKVHSGTPEHVRISEEEGGIIAWETLQTDAAGNVSLYRIIKRTLLMTDDGFTEILLCNRK